MDFCQISVLTHSLMEVIDESITETIRIQKIILDGDETAVRNLASEIRAKKLLQEEFYLICLTKAIMLVATIRYNRFDLIINFVKDIVTIPSGFTQKLLDIFFQVHESNSTLSESDRIFFLKRLCMANAVKSEEVVKRIKLISEQSDGVLNYCLFFYWFGEDIEKFDPALYHDSDVLTKSRSSSDDLRDLADKLAFRPPEYLEPRKYTGVFEIIKNDDIFALNNYFSENEYDPEMTLKVDSFRPPWILQDNLTLIQFAIYCGSIKCFYLLWSFSNESQKPNKNKNIITEVQLAIANNLEAMLTKLLDMKYSWEGSLHIAATFHRTRIFQWILINKNPNMNEIHPRYGTILHQCASMNNIELLLFIIEFNIDMNCLDNGMTPLHQAILYENTEIIKILLSHEKTDPNILINGHIAPISYCIAKKRTDYVKLLLECNRTNVNNQTSDQMSILQEALKAKAYDCAKLIAYQLDIDFNVVDANGRTMLQNAVRDGDIEAVNILISHPGINLSCNQADVSLIYQAVQNGNLEMLKLLTVKVDSNEINKSSPSKFTALHIAVKKKFTHIVKFLLEQPNIDVNATNDHIFTPLHIAAAQGYNDIVILLLNHPSIDVNKQDELGSTPLHLAAEGSHVETVRILLQNLNVNANLKNKVGVFYKFILLLSIGLQQTDKLKLLSF